MTWKQMANRLNVSLTFVRNRHSSKHWEKDAAKYGYIKYYKHHQDEVDPPITPSKVLMIRRVFPFKGNPWWEKNMLKELRLEENCGPVFVKNTPEICSRIWTIKHLIEIFPVEIPDNLKSFDESKEYHVDEYGRVHICGKVDPIREKATMDYKTSIKRLNPSTISEKLRLLWVRGNAL